ncbi:DUF922 domain-containing protein [Consotaella salsifontis]|uniref:Predicted secreted Zn-dependent protease n=1 Tax=Consotaella salsifontis TaxID=1365950 RepID=A0A1T4P7B0_9HYPH|nr:DUF922 domain-containing protein [Consotaella salsifontis]SJZ87349.1 Predicted secreted Zn-dependent protease [Consotaella salsifontis]
MRTFFILSLTLAAAALSLSGSATAGQVKESTKYFMVRGNTLEELDRELAAAGPKMEDTGIHHPASTEVKFDGRVTYRATADGCSVDRANLRLSLKLTLPKWKPRKPADAATTLIWKTVSSDILRHEREHAAIAKEWLDRTEMAIRNLRHEPNCEAMEAKVKSVTDDYLAAHQKAQMEFDLREGREIGWRLKRALRKAIADADGDES